MARKPSVRDIETLNVKADLAYALLEYAVEHKDEVVLGSAKVVYDQDFGKFLGSILPCYDIVSLHKTGKRTGYGSITGIIFQYLIMSDSYPDSYGLRHELPNLNVKEDPKDGIGGLRAWIDAEEPVSTGFGVVFRDVQEKSRGLRKAGRYDLVLRAIQHVRENYPCSSRLFISIQTATRQD